MDILRRILFVACSLIVATPLVGFNPELFHDRKNTVVYIEYFIQMEVDRQQGEAVGLVANEEGLIVCLDGAFASWIPPKRFRDIKAYLPENTAPSGYPLRYLGQDEVNGWHYLQLEDPEAMERLHPITDYETAIPEIGEPIWGFGLTNGEIDYTPYFQDGRLSTIQSLPLKTGFTTVEIAVPGGPLFNFEGQLLGWSMPSFPLDRDLWIGGQYYSANLRNPDESFTFLMAEPFLENLGKYVPKDPLEDNRGWLGIVGSQPVDKDTSEFLGLENQGAVVVSEVLPDSPAEIAGLKGRDIILGVDGELFPRYRPMSVVLTDFERRLLTKGPGDSVTFTVLRGDEELEISAILGEPHKRLKATEIEYYSEWGFSIREFLFGDAVQRREDYRKLRGVVVSFVRTNSPAASSELYLGDWILEINGQAVADFESAKGLLAKTKEEGAKEIVFLIRRGNETTVLRLTPEEG